MTVNDSEEAIRDFMSRGGWTFPVMLSGDDVARSYGVRAIPTLVVIDSGGRVVQTIIGGVTASELSSLVDDLTR